MNGAANGEVRYLRIAPELAEQVDDRMQQQGQSRSELLRAAVLRYLDECKWPQLLEYGEQRARALGISPEDVGSLVEAYRAEAAHE